MSLSNGYIAAAVPAKTIAVSNTTLFAIAAREFGDALRWVDIAEINGLVDPWIVGLTDIKIPPVIDKADAPTGILGGDGSAAPTVSLPASNAPVVGGSASGGGRLVEDAFGKVVGTI